MKKNSDKTNHLIDMSFKSAAIKDPLKMDDTIAANYRGYVILDPDKDFVLKDETGKILENSCPTHAITYQNDNNNLKIHLDNGKCILCGNCQVKSPELIKITNKFDLAKKRRDDLIETFSMSVPFGKTYDELGQELKSKINTIFGRSLTIREIDAGSCNGCEIEINALNNSVYDIERFGITFVASPRHADILLVTGPASKNMERALKIAYDSTPNPKIVIAVGACACSGGIFGNNYATTGGIDNIVPVNVYIPGCPPRPQALLYGILMAINKI